MQPLCLPLQSLSPCEPCLVGSVNHVLHVSFIPISLLNSPPHLQDSQSSKERDLIVTFNLEILCILSGCQSVQRLSFAASQSVSDGDWTRHQGMNMAEYHQDLFFCFDFKDQLSLALPQDYLAILPSVPGYPRPQPQFKSYIRCPLPKVLCQHCSMSFRPDSLLASFVATLGSRFIFREPAYYLPMPGILNLEEKGPCYSLNNFCLSMTSLQINENKSVVTLFGFENYWG